MALIVNPVARPAAHARLLAQLRRATDDLRIDWTTPEEPGTGQAARAAADGADLVIAAGGDGTIRSVALGLAHTGVPLGVLALGTANVLARNLGLPVTPGGQVRVALHGIDRRIDLGRVSFGVDPGPVAVGAAGAEDPAARDSSARGSTARGSTAGGWSAEDGFVVLAGMGHDAAAVADTDVALKRRFGWFSYLVRGSRRLASAPLPMRITIDGRTTDTEAWSLLFGNFPGVPAGIQVFPGARPDDGLLDVLQARIKHPAQWVSVLAGGLSRRPVWGDGLVRTQAREVIVQLPSATGVQLDGDTLPVVTRARFRVDAGALLVRTPRRGTLPRIGSSRTQSDVENR